MSKYGSVPEKKVISTLTWIAALCLISNSVSAWQYPYEDIQLMQHMYGASNPYSVNPYNYSPAYRNYGSWNPQTMSGYSPWDRRRFGSYMNRPSPNWKIRGGINEWGNVWFVMEYKGNIFTGGGSIWDYPRNVGNW